MENAAPRTLMNHMSLINHAAVEGQCEDSYAYCFCETYGMLGVFDGCGGLGARRYEKLDNRTGAYIASRVAGKTALEWFERDMPCDQTGMYQNAQRAADGLKQHLDKALADMLAEIEPAGRPGGGTMIRPLPTTASIALMDWSDAESIRCLFMWAGDSRCFILRPDGLRQCTRDDLRIEGDAFENLYGDSPLSNLVSADGDYRINSARIVCRAPAIVLAATDGTFGYWPSPMHFEWLLTDTLMRADSPEDWEKRLGAQLEEVAADDATLVMAAFGWQDFECMRRDFAQRHEYLCNGLNGAETQDALREFWQEYRQGYYVKGEPSPSEV